MTDTIRTLLRRAGTAAGLLLLAEPALAELGLNMTRGVTPFSEEVYRLHMLIFWICVAIGVVVFGAMFISMYQHRKSRGAEPAQFQHNTRLEAVWTVIPFLILVVMAVPATQTLVEMEDTSEYEMTVKVTGYQWMWGYEYVDEGVSFISKLDEASNRVRQLNSGEDPASVDNYLLNVDNPLVLPVDTKVRFLITAADVIHSWWVPALGWKRDAIPGYMNEAWTMIREEGTYRGQCAELCGKDHGFMPVVIKAVSKEEFRDWLAEQSGREAIQVAQEAATKESPAAAQETDAEQAGTATDAQPAPGGDWSMAIAMEQGERVYTRQCAACHQPNGQGMPPAFPPIVGSPSVEGDVTGHLDVVVNGAPGTAMQAFGDLLSDEDIAAVVTYERNAWGIESGDLVKPADVAAFKEQ